MTFNCTIWEDVGTAGFSAGEVNYVKLAFSPSGYPYVAFEDSAHFNRASVMKFNGVNWIYIGVPGFSVGSATALSLAFSQTGEPYVAFRDEYDYEKASLMKYDSVLVGTKEPHPIQISIHPNPASDKLGVDVPGNSQSYDLSILNLQGQQVLSRKLWVAKTTIDISSFPSGVYTVKVTGETTQMVRKFVKL